MTILITLPDQCEHFDECINWHAGEALLKKHKHFLVCWIGNQTFRIFCVKARLDLAHKEKHVERIEMFLICFVDFHEIFHRI